MALTGSSHSFLKEFTQQVALTGTSKEALERSKAQAFFNKRLDALTGSLREAATKQDAELSMRLERICIAFERQEYAVHICSICKTTDICLYYVFTATKHTSEFCNAC